MDHARKMSHSTALPFAVWKRKMEDNELTASVTSEILVYFHLPELRQHTFTHPIYADRFLSDPVWQAKFAANPQCMEQELLLLRRAPMFSEPDHSDLPAYWIYRFSNQNEAWHAIWAYHYNKVESLMWALQSNPNRAQALDAHIAALQSPHCFPQHGVPFFDEAVAFHGVYQAGRNIYDRAMCSASGQLR
jgi:hypothetical protein